MLAWDDLRYVLAVAREGTLSKAAKRLGVNHSTVSRRLTAASEQLGVRLFERLPDGYVPTKAGEDVVRVAERLEEDVLSLESRVLGRDAELKGALRVSTTDMLAWRLIPELPSFFERYPQVQLELTVGYQVSSLTKREADVAIRVTNAPPEHLVGRKVARMEFALYASRALHARMGDASLEDYPWLAWDRRSGARMTERWMELHVPEARVVMTVDDAPSMVRATRRGVGISFLACIDADEEDELVRLRDVEPGFGMDLWVLTHPDLRETARVRAFTAFANELYAGWSDRFAGRAD